jgi:hypothetical protein
MRVYTVAYFHIDTAENNKQILSRAGLELASLGIWTAVLPIELSSQRGLVVSSEYYPIEVHEIFSGRLDACLEGQTLNPNPS